MVFELQMAREEVTRSVFDCESGEDEPDVWKLVSHTQELSV